MCLAPFLNAMVLCCKKYTTKKYYHFLVVFVIIGLLASQWALDMDVIKNFVLLDHTAKEAKKEKQSTLSKLHIFCMGDDVAT